MIWYLASVTLVPLKFTHCYSLHHHKHQHHYQQLQQQQAPGWSLAVFTKRLHNVRFCARLQSEYSSMLTWHGKGGSCPPRKVVIVIGRWPSHPSKMCKNALISTFKLKIFWEHSSQPQYSINKLNLYGEGLWRYGYRAMTFGPSIVSNACLSTKFSVGTSGCRSDSTVRSQVEVNLCLSWAIPILWQTMHYCPQSTDIVTQWA